MYWFLLQFILMHVTFGSCMFQTDHDLNKKLDKLSLDEVESDAAVEHAPKQRTPPHPAADRLIAYATMPGVPSGY